MLLSGGRSSFYVPLPLPSLSPGSTPLGCYKKLIEYYKNGELSFQYVKTFNMDEYVGRSLLFLIVALSICSDTSAL